jgi:hypothetical protein
VKPVAKICAVAAAATLIVGRVAPKPAYAQDAQPGGSAGPPILIDALNDVSQWKAVPSDGVSLAIVSGRGENGGAMRLDFDFHGGAGYAVAHRAVSLDLPANYELTFDIRGIAPSENVEVKLIDASGENVWWVDRRDYDFPAHWTRFIIKRRQISFAWGPRGGGELKHAAAIEIAITAGSGGKGSVWIDNLVLTPQPPAVLHPPPLSASASNGAASTPAANAVDGNPHTLWRSGSVGPVTLTIDLGLEREFGGLTVQWDSTARARDYDVDVSDDGRTWKTAYQLLNGAGDRDDLYMPQSEARWVRLRLGEPPRGGFAIGDVAVQPLAWSETLNAFDFAVAKQHPRGNSPRAFTDSVQTYWTLVGAPAAEREALVSEDGAVEIGKAQFSLEPFLYEAGRLATWADARTSQSLADGDLPIPSVHWSLNGAATHLALTTTAWVAGPGDSATLYVRYRVSNIGTAAMRVTLFVTLRPFQVNGPFQFLNTAGGAAIVREIRYEHGIVHVTGAADSLVQSVVPLTPPTSFGASTFDAGGALRSMRIGRVPSAPTVIDASGRADAVLSYALDLGARATRDVVIAVPFAAHSTLRPLLADSASELAEHELRRTAAEWRARVDRVAMHLPPDAMWLARTLRSQQAYILINQDGPRIQPGSRAYERSWIRDGALTSDALLRTGHADRVAAFLDWYAPFQFASGKVPCCVDQRGADPVPEDDSNGEFLFLVHQLYRYTGDTVMLRRMWPRVTLAVNYLDSLRHIERVPANRTPARLQFYGLLPPSISHEGYSAKPMHSYWDDFWALRGFRDAAAVAAALGKPADSARFGQIAHEFENDLLASIRAAQQAHGIDFIPGSADLGDFDATSTTIALEPGGEQSVLPEPALANTFDRYWRIAFARATGREPWKDYTPYELRTVGSFVRLGEPQRSLALLDFFHKGQRPAEWNEWAEVVRRDPRAPGFIGDMPHTWVGSDFIRSLLDMFVYERDSVLVVGAGIPERWAGAAGGAGISRLRTPYGLINVDEHTAIRGATNVVHIAVSGLTRMPPGGIVVNAPFPLRPVRATVNGRPARLRIGGAVMLTSLPASVEFAR